MTKDFPLHQASTLKGVGDDAAVIAPTDGEEVLFTTDSFYEGVDFDLTYFPLKHLGYKVVTAGVSDILAMNALPSQITVSLGVSDPHRAADHVAGRGDAYGSGRGGAERR